jgi:hypothetical protein
LSELGLSIRERDFQLDLPVDWKRREAARPGHWVFSSDLRRSEIIVSLRFMQIPKDRILEMANAFANLQREIEIQLRRESHVQFGDSWVEEREKGELVHIAYASSDDFLIVRFMGWVTQTKFLGLRVQTLTRNNEVSKRVFDEVFGGFRFSIP